NYYVGCLKEEPKNNLDIAADLLADTLDDSIIPDDKIEHERDIILNELRQRRDLAPIRLYESSINGFFKNQSLGRSAGGLYENISRLCHDDFRDVLAMYTGEKMVVGITGPDSEEEMAGIIARNFGRMAKNAHKI